MSVIEAKLPHDAEKGNIKERALDLLIANCTELFADQYGKPYAVTKVNDHHETISIASSNFKHWIASLHYTQKQETLISENINSIINTLKGRSLFDGVRKHIEIRVTSMPSDDSTIYYDFINRKWQCVKIDASGWTVERARYCSRDITTMLRRPNRNQAIPEIFSINF